MCVHIKTCALGCAHFILNSRPECSRTGPSQDHRDRLPRWRLACSGTGPAGSGSIERWGWEGRQTGGRPGQKSSSAPGTWQRWQDQKRKRTRTGRLRRGPQSDPRKSTAERREPRWRVLPPFSRTAGMQQGWDGNHAGSREEGAVASSQKPDPAPYVGRLCLKRDIKPRQWVLKGCFSPELWNRFFFSFSTVIVEDDVQLEVKNN